MTIRQLERRFDDFLDYARHVERKSPATLHGYKGAFQNFRKFLATDTRKAVGQAGDLLFAIASWVGWNNARGISAFTTNHYWRALRAFFIDLEARDGWPNPFRGMKQPVLPSALPKALREEECRRILVAADNYPWADAFERTRAVALFSTLIYAGLRRGELTRLLFNDVDLKAGTLLVRQGKGIGGGKDRTAYLCPELREALEVYVGERQRARIVVPGFFAAAKGSGLTLSDSTLIRIVRKVRAASGVRFSIHSLRHSFVTLLLKRGIPLHVARDLAGHASIRTTEGYLRVFDEDKHREIRKLTLR